MNGYMHRGLHNIIILSCGLLLAISLLLINYEKIVIFDLSLYSVEGKYDIYEKGSLIIMKQINEVTIENNNNTIATKNESNQIKFIQDMDFLDESNSTENLTMIHKQPSHSDAVHDDKDVSKGSTMMHHDINTEWMAIVVYSIPYIGSLLNFMQTIMGMIIFFIIPFLIFSSFMLHRLISMLTLKNRINIK
ncbi:hypothetical protein [Longirhabdus pacifica]|uniref:hypothetical protein n=1 Tax=Longirhabdus pacifica TaxID=2305227 RepID=UPI001008849D|nr:hypothetical protein [Longirhabdus pacifica]